MGKLHDRLKEIGYTGHSLEVYLVRILFLLFAEDTTIFDKQQFQNYVEQRTNIDGSDLAAKLQELFQVLNTSNQKRFKNLDEQLAAFPYVNGKLFEEILPTASFDSKMRQALLECCYIDWSKISPAIFGSMFQSVMNPKERRNLGAHYTSEINILKLIKPLFLDELYKEFEKVKDSKIKLQELHSKLASLKFLDPACGCGNFLIIAYRELRLLELEIIKLLLFKFQKIRRDVALDADIKISSIIKLNVNQFYGIEYEEFPTRIAEVAMLLINHQMNLLLANEFGQNVDSIPIKSSSTIVNGNALQINWATLKNENAITVYADELNYKSNMVVEPAIQYGTFNVIAQKVNKISNEDDFPEPKAINRVQYDYIIGNPPFSGSKIMSQTMRDDVVKCFNNSQGAGVLDYVAAWYIKAAKYIQHTNTKVAFVSTNSIVQGEQVSILWGQMLSKYNIKIHFSHRTFKWSNEAKGNAAVYCVIVGFANFDVDNKIIYDYEDIKGEAHEIKANNINPYLLDAKDVFIEKKRKPICNIPEISFGNMPNDGGHLLLSDEEKIAFLQKEPAAEKFIKPLLSAKEFLNGKNRWCLWLKEIQPYELGKLKEVLKRVKAVKEHRSKSDRLATNKLADYPTLFGEIRQPETNYILIPRVSSGERNIIPMSFFNKDFIVSDTCLAVPNATLFHFGILQSKMHMIWVNNVCGRLKGDYRYSNEIVYNNFPFPLLPAEKHIKLIEEKAQKILDIRLEFSSSSLAQLYDIEKTPPALVKAHNELDKAVDTAYRSQVFASEAKRMEFLFELYEKYTANLFTKKKK